MRLMIAVLASLGLMTTACGKKQEAPKPEPTKAATTEPTKAPETAKPPEETKAPETKAAEADVAVAPAEDVVAAAPEDAAPVAPAAVDRVAEVTKDLAAYAAGKFDETFANFADNATWTELGNPMQAEPVSGKAAIIEFHKKQEEGFSELKFKPSRVFDAGEYVLVEAAWSAKNTAAMQGHEPTNKEVAVAGAYVLHYGADGKVDKAWAAFDSAAMLTQLGMMPGAAAPAVLAETTELVKGDANQANVDAYKATVEKLNATNVDEVLGGQLADDYEHTAYGQTVKGKAEALAALKASMATMGDLKITVDLAVSTGDWVIAAQTQSYTYKGGMEGIEAKDQKVVAQTLVVARFEGGKLKAYRSYGNMLGLLAQLGVQLGGAAEKPADAAGDKLGVESCDKFLAAYAACVDAMPEANRGPSKEAAAQMSKSWKDAIAQGGDAVKQGLEDACKKALESTKTAMAAACPGVKWE